MSGGDKATDVSKVAPGQGTGRGQRGDREVHPRFLSTCLFFYFVCLRRRPSTVPDIDEKDLENPQLCAEYTVDVYAYLRSCLRRRAIIWLNSRENI